VRISQKAEYALRAMLDLALHAPQSGGARSSEIAKRTRVPRKFLEAILLELRKAGFVSSKRGPDGGHWLSRDPARLTVATILQAIDGATSVADRGLRADVSGAQASLHRLWARVDDAVSAVVGSVTLEDLRREADAHAPIDFSI
jgi:Rrf2 family protein